MAVPWYKRPVDKRKLGKLFIGVGTVGLLDIPLSLLNGQAPDQQTVVMGATLLTVGLLIVTYRNR